MVKIKRVKLEEPIEVYDITVEDNHNFFANNILVHNCSEIFLQSSIEESFVCCLSQMNLLYFDEWKHTDAPETLTIFLDTVLTDFINKGKNYAKMEKAVKFAENQRAIGIGVLGYHSYLQSKMIPFDQEEAFRVNNEIFSLLQEKTLNASKYLAELLGEPELLKGYGRRNTTLMSIAPTKSSSFILGQVSPQIEPFKQNYFVKDVAKAKTVYKNPFLEKLLQEKGLDNDYTWENIADNNGSVQYLDGLTREEKAVFKTFEEINPITIIQQAAQRQQFIDQGQSINLMVSPSTPKAEISKMYLLAEELGIKSIYYQYSQNAAQDVARNLDCVSCSA